MDQKVEMKQLIEEAEQVLIKTYNRFQIVLDKGEDVYLYDIEGKEYLDFVAGIAVFALGYGNQEFNDTLKGQIDKLIHTSNYYYNIPMIEAATKIKAASGMDKIFFTNSGTEAIEGAIKLARKYYYEKHGKAGGEIIAMNHSFHGRSMGAVSVTGNVKYREPFEPLIGGVKFAEINDINSVKECINDNTCAILLETIQGEGGIYPVETEFITELRKLCNDKDILLILDEIQCGMGRTGKMFAYQNFNIEPDIITCAKALGCGVPVGAFAAVEKVAKAFKPGDHGTTYGGNPFVAAAISKVFDLFESLKVLEHVNEIAPYLTQKLDELADKHKVIVAHRGIGLMQGLEFSVPVKDIVKKAMDSGLILIAAGTNIIRFVPPLIIKKEHIDKMIEILDKSIEEAV